MSPPSATNSVVGAPGHAVLHARSWTGRSRVAASEPTGNQYPSQVRTQIVRRPAGEAFRVDGRRVTGAASRSCGSAPNSRSTIPDRVGSTGCREATSWRKNSSAPDDCPDAGTVNAAASAVSVSVAQARRTDFARGVSPRRCGSVVMSGSSRTRFKSLFRQSCSRIGVPDLGSRPGADQLS